VAVQPRSEETYQRILKAAEDSFARSGYDATGVAEICRQAGISKGAFYHHFSSKQALFLNLFEHWLADLHISLAQTRERAANVPAAIKSMANQIRAIFRQGGSQFSIFLEFLTKSSREPEIWQAIIAPYRRYHDYFSEMIEEGIREGSLRKVDPKKTAQILVSLAVGIIVQGIMDPSGADWENLIKEALELLLTGLRGKSSI
jgi:AcrR family transcriptional regulator